MEQFEHYKSDKYWCVYVHINKTNRKIYIGISQDTKKRWSNYKNCRYFYYAIEKYGWDNFEHIILMKDIPDGMIDIIERELIKKYQATNHDYGYNISHGGKGGPALKGYDNPKSIPVYQYDLKGNFIKEWPNARMAGIELSVDDYEIAMSAQNLGKRHAGNFLWSYKKYNSIEVKKDFRRKYERVYQIDLNGQLVAIHDNIDSIDGLTKAYGRGVRKCCVNESLTYNKYIWMYESDYSISNVNKRIEAINYSKDCTKKKICMYSLNGEFLKLFLSAKEAEEYTGLRHEAISLATRRRDYSHRSGNYLWYREEETNCCPVDPYTFSPGKTIYQFDLLGNFIKKYHSKREAEDVYGKAIGNNIKTHKAYDFYWIYEDELQNLKDVFKLKI